jgi:hypothetical protein
MVFKKFLKFSILSLAAFTGAAAFLCNNCTLQLAESNSKKESTSSTNTGDVRNLTVDGNQHNNLYEAEAHPLLARKKTYEELVHWNDWREWEWPPQKRAKWLPGVRFDFEEVVIPHLPWVGIELPSPLIPTQNKTLHAIYKIAAVAWAMEEQKPTPQRRLEFAQLDNLSKNFMLATKCRWEGDCGVYKQLNLDLSWYDLLSIPVGIPAAWIVRNLIAKPMYRWMDGLEDGSLWKAKVYDQLKTQLKLKTEQEALVNLGKQLQALGLPQSQIQ